MDIYRTEKPEEEKKEWFARCTHCKVAHDVNYGPELVYVTFTCENIDAHVSVCFQCFHVYRIDWANNEIKGISFEAIQRYVKDRRYMHPTFEELKKIQQEINSEKYADVSGGTRQSETEIVGD